MTPELSYEEAVLRQFDVKDIAYAFATFKPGDTVPMLGLDAWLPKDTADTRLYTETIQYWDREDD